MELKDLEWVKTAKMTPPKLEKPVFNASNPSILYDNGLYYILLRCTNYTLKGKPTACTPRYTTTFYTQNWIGTTTNPLVSPTNWKPVKDCSTHKIVSDKVGLEDCRLVKWKNQMYLSGTRRDFNTGGMGRIMLSAINEDKDCWYESGYWLIEGTCNDNNFCEKNHQPILDKPLHYIASNNPIFVYKVNTDTNRIISVKGNTRLAGCNLLGCIRGSSQIVPFGDKYYSIVHHSNTDETGQHHYLHHIVTYDKDFNVLKISDGFKFEGKIIEFCCGMCINPETEMMYISYSLMDTKPSVMEIPLSIITTL